MFNNKFVVASAIIGLFVGTLGLTGCGGMDSIGQHKEYVIKQIVNGKTVYCVEIRTDHGASIDCDFGGNK